MVCLFFWVYDLIIGCVFKKCIVDDEFEEEIDEFIEIEVVNDDEDFEFGRFIFFIGFVEDFEFFEKLVDFLG